VNLACGYAVILLGDVSCLEYVTMLHYRRGYAIKPKAQQIEEVNLAWDDIQAKVDADYELAQRFQAKEQEQLTDAEKARLFMDFLEKRKKFFTAKRAKEKRNKPPTKAKQRSLMCTYLKNMDGWKKRALKNKSFADIEDLFNK
nr:hypothetical protein [Tanacetum cinerariifolium]